MGQDIVIEYRFSEARSGLAPSARLEVTPP
jgi:hypothetical protein